jgi:hypothetical protein
MHHRDLCEIRLTSARAVITSFTEKYRGDSGESYLFLSWGLCISNGFQQSEMGMNAEKHLKLAEKHR